MKRAFFFDMIFNTIVAKAGTKSIPIKSTGHEKDHATIVLAAKADGTKLKPFVVFKNAKREVKRLEEGTSNAIIRSSNNGWMNQELTTDWLRTVYGKFHFKNGC